MVPSAGVEFARNRRSCRQLQSLPLPAAISCSLSFRRVGEIPLKLKQSKGTGTRASLQLRSRPPTPSRCISVQQGAPFSCCDYLQQVPLGAAQSKQDQGVTVNTRAEEEGDTSSGAWGGYLPQKGLLQQRYRTTACSKPARIKSCCPS